jgi:hypothetical protein
VTDVVCLRHSNRSRRRTASEGSGHEASYGSGSLETAVRETPFKVNNSPVRHNRLDNGIVLAALPRD